jgi:hypothetical protein
VHEGEPPAHQHCRDTNPYERVSHGTRSVTEGEHAAPDKDERGGSEEVRDELDGAGAAEHRQPV